MHFFLIMSRRYFLLSIPAAPFIRSNCGQGEGRVDTNYYLLSVESLETDTGRLETGEVLQAFFDEKIWLFKEKTPSVEALSRGDKLLVYGLLAEGRAILGRFTLRTEPRLRQEALFGIEGRLKKRFLLGAEITDALIWESPKPLSELEPQLAIFAADELSPFYLNQGLREITKQDFQRIIRQGEESGEALQEQLPLGGEGAELDREQYRSVLESLLKAAEWLEELGREGIPKQLGALQKAAAQQRQMPLLKERISVLANALEAERETAANLRQQNDKLRHRLAGVQQELEQEKQEKAEQEKESEEMQAQFEQERRRLLGQIGSLKTKIEEQQQSLAEIGTVKKALQRIIFLLRGDERKSS